MKKLLVYLGICMSLLQGCQPDLGDFKYLNEQPDVTVTILSTQLEPAISEYSSPILKFSGVAQENKPFPVKNYRMTIQYKVSTPAENNFSSLFNIEMVDGKASFQGELYLAKFPSDTRKNSLKFGLKEASWYPKTKARVELNERNSIN